MSSGTSTSADVRPQPRTTGERSAGDQLQPWQFFVIAALGCATAVVFINRSQGALAVVLLSILMGAAALVGLAALRTLRPLMFHYEDRTSMFGHRTRVAL